MKKSKEDNRFKFKSFNDRLNEINIRKFALYHVEHENEELEDSDDTYFIQTVKKWNVLNLTDEYNGFSKKVQNVVTLPQLLHKKDFVIDVLLESIATATNLSLQPLLEIVVVLSRDLREEFYGYVPRILDRLISLLNTKDSDQLEWTLISLAFLFKSMKSIFKKDIIKVFDLLLPLLDEKHYSEEVTNFAVECFAFVSRDINDHNNLIDGVLSTIQLERTKTIYGCGRLFFEIVRGVPGQFHSIGEKFLTVVLEKFMKKLEDIEKYHEIVKSTVFNILGHVNPQNMQLFWQTAAKILLSSDEKTKSEGIDCIIRLLIQIAEYKNGLFVGDVESIVSATLALCDHLEDTEVLINIAKLSSLILLSSNAKITQYNTSRIIKRVTLINNRQVFEYFIDSVKSHTQFDLLILPELVKYVEKFINEDNQGLYLLAKIVLYKRPLSCDDKGIDGWSAYQIPFKNPKTKSIIEKAFVKVKLDEEELLLFAILAPHIKLDQTLYLNKVKEALKSIKEDESSLFALLILLECAVYLGISIENLKLSKHLKELDFKSVTSLKILTLALKYEKLENEQKNKDTKVLANNLMHGNNQIRTLSIYCLSKIHGKASHNLYNVFLEIENIESTVQTYRDQILLMQKLHSNSEYFKELKNDEDRLNCFRFLLGLLYRNFKLIWEPSMSIVKDYSQLFSVEEFWPIYKQQLENTAEAIESKGSNTISSPSFEWSTLSEIYSTCVQDTDTVNHHNYRKLLWSALSSFPHIAEKKNKEVVPLFLNFVSNEYKPQFETKQNTWDISAKENLETDDNEKPNQSSDGKIIIETLITKLNVFKCQPNPKAMFKEPELHTFYMDLLSTNNPLLQKAAMECLNAYKSKAITPYIENLYNMIDEKKFKLELASFNIDKESGTIKPDHRNELMIVILRIIYGKMLTKSPNKIITGQVRKSIIFRFLGTGTDEEVRSFFDLAFCKCADYLKMDLEEIPSKMFENFDQKAVLSPKRLQNFMNLLEAMVKEFGNLLFKDDFLIYLLKILTLTGVICNKVLKIDDVSSSVTNAYKSIKNSATLNVVNFFQQFTDFSWTDGLQKTVMDVFVWPYLEKLSSDSIHTPTPLLKLVLQWTKNYKHFEFLGVDNSGLVPMKEIIELLLNDKSKINVRNEILDGVGRLLEEKTNPADLQSTISGVHILQPYMSELLKYLNTSLLEKKSSKKFTISKRDLSILSHLSKYVEENETCVSLLQILIQILISKNKITSDESTLYIIQTLCNLFAKLDEPEVFIIKIAPLFETIEDISSRKLLCSILTNIGKRLPQFKELAVFVNDLNAWNRKWIEQPDYEKRINTMSTLKTKFTEENIELELGVLVIYNCFYFLRFDKDLGLRVNTGELLKQASTTLVLKYSTEDKKKMDFLIDKVLFDCVQTSIKSSNDNLRNESIMLLGELAHKCKDVNPVLLDLNSLTDSDSEVDFFENLTHLQVFKHGKALSRFASIAKSKHQFQTQTYNYFMLPIVTSYLCNDTYADKHTLIDATMEALSVICRQLPWPKYETLLKNYLRKLRTLHTHQKQSVRIIMAILDAFHFGCEPEFDKDENYEPSNKKIKEEDHSKPVQPSHQLSKKIITDIVKNLIPTLNNCITDKGVYDAKHKVNRRRTGVEREDEEILRVPIALAITKLLQKLPKEYLDANLSGIFLKTCTFLRSPLKSVRMLTRDILKKIILSLGSAYLPQLIDYLTSLLTRGFQVHVLSVTIHGVLDCLKESFTEKHLEACMQNILEVSLNDIFGSVAAEKEVGKILSNTPEAKPSNKSFLILHILARNIDESCLIDLLLPFKEHLAMSQSRKMTQKIQECFQQIVSGLIENQKIEPDKMLIFVHGVLSQSISDLLPDNKTDEKKQKKLQRLDCFIIPQAPRSKTGVINKNIKTNNQANAHLLIEFGLELLHVSIKRKKIQEIDNGYEQYLNPMLDIIRDSLSSNKTHVVIVALKCLTALWNNKYELPQLENILESNDEHIGIVDTIFQILHEHATFGTTKQDDNFHLVNTAFKLIVAMLRNCEYYHIKEDHIPQLLLYIENDINENQKQPMAFDLLKSLVYRKVSSKEIHDIMGKLSELSIVSENLYTRNEARSIVFTYVLEYDLKKKVGQILKFFITQLNFSLASGRKSAIDFFNLVIRKFPQKVLEHNAEFIYISLGTRLLIEDAPECRKAIAENIELLINNVTRTMKEKLFDMTLLFFEGESMSIREMGASLVIRFVEQEKTKFAQRVPKVLPILVEQISSSVPGKFVQIAKEDSDDEEDLTNDHEIIQVQNCILKILEECSVSSLYSKFQDLHNVFNSLAFHSQRLLSNDHQWVRINAISILIKMMELYDSEAVARLLLGQNPFSGDGLEFINSDPEESLKSLVLDLCAQFIPGETNETVIEKIMQIFLLIANIFGRVEVLKTGEDNGAPKINLFWMMKRIQFVVSNEVTKTPKDCKIRTAIFNFIDSLLTLLETQVLESLAPNLLKIIVREMSEDDHNIDDELRKFAIKLGNKLRKKISNEAYDSNYRLVKTQLMQKRGLKRKIIAQEKINNPVLAAKRKKAGAEKRTLTKKTKKFDVKPKKKVK